MNKQEEVLECMSPKPRSQSNENLDDVFLSANSEFQIDSNISAEEDQFYSLGSIKRVDSISCRTGDDLVMPDDLSSLQCRYQNSNVHQNTNDIQLPFLEQFREVGNGTPIDLNRTLTQFQSLCRTVMELRDSNRKILRSLNQEENFQRKKNETKAKARQEMEDHLTELEERWKMRQERINALKSTLDGISQNVEKLETIIKAQGQQLQSQGRRGQHSTRTTNTKGDVVLNGLEIQPSMDDRGSTDEKIKRNENGLKSKTLLGNEDNRIQVLRRKQRKIEKAQEKRKHKRKTEHFASGAKQGATALVMEDRHNEMVSRRSGISRAVGLSPADTVQVLDQNKYIERDKWIDLANEALEKGRREHRPTGDGPGTILLLDISSSMAGEPFAQMKNIAKQFLRDVERHSEAGTIQENMALVTFGDQTQVLRFACNDYQGIIRNIEHLQVGGPSPMVGGLLMALAAGICCAKHRICNITVQPRVILISDGKATSENILAGPDRDSPFYSKDDIHHQLLTCATKLADAGIKIYCVPVDNADMMHLEGISNITDGKVFRPQEIGRLSRMYKNMKYAFNIRSVIDCKSEHMLRILLQTDAFTGEIEPGDRDDVISYILDPEYQGTIHEEFDENIPCIGTRVRRGPNWHNGDQDKHGAGTVVGQTPNGMVWVKWDGESKEYHKYHCGVNGGLEVVEVDEPRHITQNQLIDVGCRVKRGKDWRYHDDDGGAGTIGVVFYVDNNSNVAVRWPNKTMKSYKYGNKGYFEVELCELPMSHGDFTSMAIKSSEGGQRWQYLIDTGEPRLSVEDMNRKNLLLTEQFMRYTHESEGFEDERGKTTLKRSTSVHNVSSFSDSKLDDA